MNPTLNACVELTLIVAHSIRQRRPQPWPLQHFAAAVFDIDAEDVVAAAVVVVAVAAFSH